MRPSLLQSFVVSFLAFTAGALAQLGETNPYITAEVVDANNFCTFLPPADSVDRNIASTEYMAHVFCTGTTPKAKSAGKLAPGFILSSHYVATADYVQVTGQIDPSKMNLNVTDEGGQYDIVMPLGASCVGWGLFVNLIEPAGHTYCMRCCNSKQFCNRGISEKGCAHIIPGDYSGPLQITHDENGNVIIGGLPAATGATTTVAANTPAASASAKASGSVPAGASASAGKSSATHAATQAPKAPGQEAIPEGAAPKLQHVGVKCALASLALAAGLALV